MWLWSVGRTDRDNEKINSSHTKVYSLIKTFLSPLDRVLSTSAIFCWITLQRCMTAGEGNSPLDFWAASYKTNKQTVSPRHFVVKFAHPQSLLNPTPTPPPPHTLGGRGVNRSFLICLLVHKVAKSNSAWTDHISPFNMFIMYTAWDTLISSKKSHFFWSNRHLGFWTSEGTLKKRCLENPIWMVQFFDWETRMK